MIYWTKVLVTAFGIINSVESFIPIYFINQLQLSTIQASILLSLLYLFRLLSGFWAALVDQRPHLYSVTISLLTTFSSVSFIILFSLPYFDLSLTWQWFLLISCCIFNGVFYQPLGTLINTVIIKVLGDYRVLFYGMYIYIFLRSFIKCIINTHYKCKIGSYIRWNKITTIITTGFIGLVMNALSKDRYLDLVLISTYLIGMVLLFIIALFFTTHVEPVNASQLDISEEQAPLLLKNALQSTSDPLQYPIYKPYSIFGEQLSHISEEEQSQLDRVFTTTDDSLRLVESVDSMSPSFYSNDILYPSFSRQTDPMNNTTTTIIPTLPSNTLALQSPLPIPTDALVAFFSKYIKSQQQQQSPGLEDTGDYFYTPQYMPKLNLWKSRALSISILLMGISQALLNTFLFIYFYSILEISIYMISCLIMVHMTSELVMSFIVQKVNMNYQTHLLFILPLYIYIYSGLFKQRT